MDPRERRWTGYFQTCSTCGKRNWIRRAACAACGATLAGRPAETALPAPVEIGRRISDRLLSRPFAWAALLTLTLALGAAFGINRVLRSTGLAPAQEMVAEAPSLPAEEALRPEPEREPAFVRPEDRRGFDKGRKRLVDGDAKGAVPFLADAARVAPNDPMVAHTYGLALLRTGDPDRALFQLERAARLAPGVSSYRLELARALVAAGHPGRAIREYESLLSREPGNPSYAQDLGALYAQTGQGDRAAALGLAPPAGGDASGGGSVDLGGAAREGQARPAAGTAFTNDDLGHRRMAGPPPSAASPRVAPSATPRPFPSATPPLDPAPPVSLIPVPSPVPSPG